MESDGVLPLLSATVNEDRVSMLRIALKAQGVSQAELARRIGKHSTHVGKVLRGEAQGSPGLWDEFAAALGYRWDYRLVRDADAMEALRNRE